MLEVSNLNVRYGDFHVIHDASLFIGHGKVVAMIGPNGHGKSTLLKALCGLIPCSGTIKFKGTDITNTPALKRVQRGLVYVPEDRRLFPDMTVKENLLLGAYTVASAETREKHFDLVYTLYPRLHERRGQLARTLSGGEAQMLALGRGIMSGADCMAVDEPSLGLSPKLIDAMLITLSELNAKGITLLLVEQNVSLLSDIVDSTYLLQEGVSRPHTEFASQPWKVASETVQ